MKKRTEELMQMLSSADTLEQYWKETQDERLDMSLASYLHQLLQQYGLKKNEVINRSGLNQIYAYQIFAGTKQPSRDKLIALVLHFPLPAWMPSGFYVWEGSANCIPGSSGTASFCSVCKKVFRYKSWTIYCSKWVNIRFCKGRFRPLFYGKMGLFCPIMWFYDL